MLIGIWLFTRSSHAGQDRKYPLWWSWDVDKTIPGCRLAARTNQTQTESGSSWIIRTWHASKYLKYFEMWAKAQTINWRSKTIGSSGNQPTGAKSGSALWIKRCSLLDPLGIFCKSLLNWEFCQSKRKLNLNKKNQFGRNFALLFNLSWTKIEKSIVDRSYLIQMQEKWTRQRLVKDFKKFTCLKILEPPRKVDFEEFRFLKYFI